jgi:DNA-binding CsgD family transcriptional regulator
MQRQMLELLDIAEEALLDRTPADAIFAELGGLPCRVRVKTCRGSRVIIAIVDTAAAPPLSILYVRDRFSLTDREAQVAMLLAQRRTNKEIALELGITRFTAERHTEKILSKLGVTSRRHVQTAIRSAS